MGYKKKGISSRAVSRSFNLGFCYLVLISAIGSFNSESTRTFKYNIYQVCDNQGCIVNGIRIGSAKPEGDIVSPDPRVGNVFTQAYRELEGKLDATLCVNSRCSSVSKKMENPLMRFVNSTIRDWDIDKFLADVEDFSNSNPFIGNNKTMTQTRINRTTRSIRVYFCMGSNWTSDDLRAVCNALDLRSCAPRDCGKSLLDAFPDLLNLLNLAICNHTKVRSLSSICELGCNGPKNCLELRDTLINVSSIGNVEELENKFENGDYESMLKNCTTQSCELSVIHKLLIDLNNKRPTQHTTERTTLGVKNWTSIKEAPGMEMTTGTSIKPTTTTKMDTAAITLKLSSEATSLTSTERPTIGIAHHSSTKRSQSETYQTTTEKGTTILIIPANYTDFCLNYVYIDTCEIDLASCQQNESCVSSKKQIIKENNTKIEQDLNDLKQSVCFSTKIQIPGCEENITFDCYKRDLCKDVKLSNEILIKNTELEVIELCNNITVETTSLQDNCTESLESCYDGSYNMSANKVCLASKVREQWDIKFEIQKSYNNCLEFCLNIKSNLIDNCTSLFKTCKQDNNCLSLLQYAKQSLRDFLAKAVQECSFSVNYTRCLEKVFVFCDIQGSCKGNSSDSISSVQLAENQEREIVCHKFKQIDTSYCLASMKSCRVSIDNCLVEFEILRKKDVEAEKAEIQDLRIKCSAFLFLTLDYCLSALANCTAIDCSLKFKELLDLETVSINNYTSICKNISKVDPIECITLVSESCRLGDCEKGLSDFQYTINNSTIIDNKINILCQKYSTISLVSCKRILSTFCSPMLICSVGSIALDSNEAFNIMTFCSLIPEINSEIGSCKSSIASACNSNNNVNCSLVINTAKSMAINRAPASEIQTQRSCYSYTRITEFSCMESFKSTSSCSGGYWCIEWRNQLDKMNGDTRLPVMEAAACRGLWTIDYNTCKVEMNNCFFMGGCRDKMIDFAVLVSTNISQETNTRKIFCESLEFVDAELCTAYITFRCTPRRFCDSGRDWVQSIENDRKSFNQGLTKIPSDKFCQSLEHESLNNCSIEFNNTCINANFQDCNDLKLKYDLIKARAKREIQSRINNTCDSLTDLDRIYCFSNADTKCSDLASCKAYLVEVEALFLKKLKGQETKSNEYCNSQTYLPNDICQTLLSNCSTSDCGSEIDLIDTEKTVWNAILNQSTNTICSLFKTINCPIESVVVDGSREDTLLRLKSAIERFMRLDDGIVENNRIVRKRRQALAAPIVRLTTKYSSYERSLPIITGAIYKNNEVCISHMLSGGYKTLCICGVDQTTRTCYSEADTESVTCLGVIGRPSRAFVNCNGQETGRYIAVKLSDIDKGTVVYILEKVASIETWRLWFGDAFAVILTILLILGFIEMAWLAVMYLFGWNSNYSKCFLTALLITVCCIRPSSADDLKSTEVHCNSNSNPLSTLIITSFSVIITTLVVKKIQRVNPDSRTRSDARRKQCLLLLLALSGVFLTLISSAFSQLIKSKLSQSSLNNSATESSHGSLDGPKSNYRKVDILNYILSRGLAILISCGFYDAARRNLNTIQLAILSAFLAVLNISQGANAMNEISDDPTPVTTTCLFSIPVLIFLNGVKNYYLRTYLSRKYRSNILVYHNKEIHPCNCSNVAWLLKNLESSMVSQSTNLSVEDKKILMESMSDNVVFRRLPAKFDLSSVLPVGEMESEVLCYSIIPDYSETSVEGLQSIMKKFCIFNRYCSSKLDACGSIYCEACKDCSDRFLINCIPRVTHLICQLVKKDGGENEYEVHNPCLGRLRSRKSIISWRMEKINESDCNDYVSICLRKVKDLASGMIDGKRRATAYRALVSLKGIAKDEEFLSYYTGWNRGSEGEFGSIRVAATHEFELDSVAWKVKKDMLATWSASDRESKVVVNGKQVTYLPPLIAVTELASIRLPIEMWEQELVADTPFNKPIYPDEKFMEQITNKISRLLTNLRIDVKNFSYELCEDLNNCPNAGEYSFSENVGLMRDKLKKTIVGYLSTVDIESVILESDGLKPAVRKPLRLSDFTHAILDCEYFKERELEVIVLINEFNSKCIKLSEELTSIFLVRKFFILPTEPTVLYEETSALAQLVESTINNISHTLAVWMHDAEVLDDEVSVKYSELASIFADTKALYSNKDRILKYLSYKKFLSPDNHCNCCNIKKSLEKICENSYVNDHLKDNDNVRYSHTLRKWYTRCGDCNHIVDLGFYNMSHHGQLYNINIREVVDDINVCTDLNINSSSTSDQVAKFWCQDKELGMLSKVDDLAFNSDENAAETLSYVPSFVEAVVNTYRQDPSDNPVYSDKCPKEIRLEINPKSMCLFSGKVEDWLLSCFCYQNKSFVVMPEDYLSVTRRKDFSVTLNKDMLPESLRNMNGLFLIMDQDLEIEIGPDLKIKKPIDIISDIVTEEVATASEMIGSRSGTTEVLVYKREGKKTMVKSKPNYIRVTRLTSIFDVIFAILMFLLCVAPVSCLDCVGCEDYPFAQEEAFWKGVPSSTLSIVNADVTTCTVTDTTKCEIVATLTSISSKLPFENLFILSKSAAVNGQQENLPQLIVSLKTLEPVTPILYDQLYWVDQAIIDKVSARFCCCGHDNACSEQNPFPQNNTYRSNCLTMEVCGCAGCSCVICYNGVGVCWYKIDLVDDQTTKEIIFKKQPKQPQILTVAVRMTSVGLEGTSTRGRRFCELDGKIYGMYGISNSGKMCQTTPVLNETLNKYNCLAVDGSYDLIDLEKCEICYTDTLLFPIKDPGCDSYCFISPFRDVICYLESSTEIDFDSAMLFGEEAVVKLLTDHNEKTCTDRTAYLDIKGTLTNITISGANCTYWCKRSNRLVSCLDTVDHVQMSPGCCEIIESTMTAAVDYKKCEIKKCKNMGSINFDKVEIIDLLPQVQSRLTSLNLSIISAFEMDQSVYPEYLVFRSGVLYTGPSSAFPPRGLSTCGGPAMYHKYDNQFYYPSSDCVSLTKLDWSHAELSVPNQFSYTKSAQFFLLSDRQSFTYTLSKDYKYLTTYYSGQKLLSTMTLQIEMVGTKIVLYRSKPKAVDLQCLADQKVCYNCGQTQIINCCIDNVGGTGESAYTVDNKEYSIHVGQGFSCYNLMSQLSTDKSQYKVCIDGICRDVQIEFYKVPEGDNRFYGVQTQVKSIQGGAFGDLSVLAISLIAIGAAIVGLIAALTSLTLCGVLCPCCPCISKFALTILSILSFLCFCRCCKDKICCCFKKPGYTMIEKAAKKTEEKVGEVRSVPSERRPLFPARSRLKV